MAYQYQAAAQPPVASDPLNEAIAKIEKAYDDTTFKLKTDKATIDEAEIEALKKDPTDFLDNYTEGLPKDLGSGLTTKVIKANFKVEDKPAGSKQGQAPATKQQLIKFKVTVADANKKEKETKEFTFEFTLNPTPPAPPTGGGGGGSAQPFSTKNNSK